MNKYFSLAETETSADIYIYGDITSYEYLESDVSSYTLSHRIESLKCSTINVYINSYGGEVAEAIAIYNALRRHSAQIKTYTDGFACSSAAIVFMAGDERIMYNSSLLFIHNAWTIAQGNAEELRKAANDTETISHMTKTVFAENVNIDDKQLEKMLAAETWITPQEALEMGFCTTVQANAAGSNKAMQNARKELFMAVISDRNAAERNKAPHADNHPLKPNKPETPPAQQHKTIMQLIAEL